MMLTFFSTLFFTIFAVAVDGKGGYGLTWGSVQPPLRCSTAEPVYPMVGVGCYGTPKKFDDTSRNGCNPYSGDTLCSRKLPILCFYPLNLPRPHYAISGNSGGSKPKEFYRGWSGGIIAATKPILGSSINSINHANRICVRYFGTGFRMASHHDSQWIRGMDCNNFNGNSWASSEKQTGGWTWYAHGCRSQLPKTRFWIYIRDQPGNCWD